MDRFLTRALLALGAALFAGLVMIAAMYPYCPQSFGGWILWFLVAFPVWLFLEWVGKHLLGGRFLDKLGRPLRIAYGVLVVGVLYVLIIFALRFLIPYLGRWGS